MPAASNIEWTEVTWNPVTGCSKISDGCRHCYAETMALRLRAMGQPRYRNGFQVTIQEDLMTAPLLWKQPKLIFVNSMSDLFHEKVPADRIQAIFRTMSLCPQHTFQVLTKRSKRLREMAEMLPWPRNVWMGVSIESEAVLERARHLLEVPAAVRFLSCEPLLGPLPGLDLSGIDWVIVGGESGPGARPMAAAWVKEIMEKCRAENVPYFFKQWGGPRKGKNGRLWHGRTYDEFPVVPATRRRRPSPQGQPC